MITASELRELLDYDPSSGVFTWRRSMRGPARQGDKAGRPKPNGYLSIKVMQRDYYAHRLAFMWMMGAWPTAEVDHVNGDRCDNRWANLREATTSQNRGNTRRLDRNSSGLKGVSLHKKTGLWRARLATKTLRYCRTKEEAHAVYVAAAKAKFGEFARAP